MSGEFAISEEPIGAESSSAGGGGSPINPPLGPSHQFLAGEVKFRYGERYVSEATNNKFKGVPRGVYLGFTPIFNGDLLSFAPDTSYRVSLARVTSQDDPLYSVDVITAGVVTLDFTDHTVFPINVVMRASGSLGQPHSAEIFTKPTAASDPTELLLCVVTAPGIVVFDDPINRSTPFAHSSAPLGFGFMKDGAVEQLLAGVALVAEIQAAREDLTGFLHANLSDRLTADMSGSAIADRLGKETRHVQGIDVIIATPATSVNVSKSFSGIHRGLAGLSPLSNISGFGSETVAAAITSGTIASGSPSGSLSDDVRNVCAIVNAVSEARFIDSNREVAYGRLSLDQITLTGTVTFNGTTTVTGAGTLFTAQIQGGDIIQDAVGNFYEVATTPILDTSLTLSTAAITSGSSIASLRRRFTLAFVRRTGVAAETSFTITGGTTVKFFFQTWNKIDQSQFDYLPLLYRNFEEPPIPTATTSVAGKALLAANAPSGKAGAIFSIQSQSAQIGQPHIIGVDFDGATLGAPGVADISQRGPIGLTGPPGAGGSPGPVGPQGPQGVGYTGTSTYFAESGVFSSAILGSGASYSFTFDFPGVTNLLWLSGGLSSWRVTGGIFADNDDHFECTDIVKVTATQGRLDGRIPTGATPASEVKWFLNGTGN